MLFNVCVCTGNRKNYRGRIRTINLAHVPPFVRFPDFLESQLPRLFFGIRHTNSMIFRNYMILNCENGLGVYTQPCNLKRFQKKKKKEKIWNQREKYIDGNCNKSEWKRCHVGCNASNQVENICCNEAIFFSLYWKSSIFSFFICFAIVVGRLLRAITMDSKPFRKVNLEIVF